MDNPILTAIALCHKPQHLPTATNNIRRRNPAQRQRADEGASAPSRPPERCRRDRHAKGPAGAACGAGA